MIETLVALLFAHVLADFVLQPGWMVQRKRDPGILLAHIAVVLAMAMLTTGHVGAPALLVLAGAHLVIDAAKIYLWPAPGRDGLAAYLVDQAAHVASILALALYAPGLWQSGFWASGIRAYGIGDSGQWALLSVILLHGMVLLGGLLLATRAGAFAIAKLMAGLAGPNAGENGSEPDGLPQGGHLIGLLERGLIFVLLLAGQPGSIGFLIAAKSILRFGAVSQDRAASEYVIIGTLASFGWAISITLATLALQSALPPLEIAAAWP